MIIKDTYENFIFFPKSRFVSPIFHKMEATVNSILYCLSFRNIYFIYFSEGATLLLFMTGRWRLEMSCATQVIHGWVIGTGSEPPGTLSVTSLHMSQQFPNPVLLAIPALVFPSVTFVDWEYAVCPGQDWTLRTKTNTLLSLASKCYYVMKRTRH